MKSCIQAHCTLCDKLTSDYMNPRFPLCRICEAVHMAFMRIGVTEHFAECLECVVEGWHPDFIVPCSVGEPYVRRWKDALIDLERENAARIYWQSWGNAG